ncbi:MAG: hypothetical protein ABIC40_04320 [bacterium]
MVAYDRLGKKQAGPAIRTLALAMELAKVCEVEVIYEGESPGDFITNKGIKFTERESVKIDKSYLAGFCGGLGPPLLAMVCPEVFESDLPLVIDLFDPVVWENLELYRNESSNERAFQHERHLAALISSLMRGDYFLAAGRHQADLFTGALMVLNRINPENYSTGRGFEQMIGLVPFGVPDGKPPEISKEKIPSKFRHDGISIIWNGGMWDWLKPETVVKAMPLILEKYPDAKLFFPGTGHPNPHIPRMAVVGKVKELVKELGISKSVVFSEWLEREEYLGVLGQSDVSVSAHGRGLESQYAVRTRFSDSIWLGVPMVVSGGDEYSRLVREYGLGEVIGDDDPVKFAEGIIGVVSRGKEEFQPGFEKAGKELSWENTAKPLREWAKNPVVTHGIGSEFFTDSVGMVSPRSRPNDFKSLMKRLGDKMRR